MIHPTAAGGSGNGQQAGCPAKEREKCKKKLKNGRICQICLCLIQPVSAIARFGLYKPQEGAGPQKIHKYMSRQMKGLKRENKGPFCKVTGRKASSPYKESAEAGG